MKDCSLDVLAYHNERVTLPQSERTNMRDRRDANRDRLKSRLKSNDKPTPKKFVKQGSYAMKTMVQDPDNDYDIDDGVYFDEDDLVKDDYQPMTAKDAREMVKEALGNDDRFLKPPMAKNSCVRVYYKKGYHVDLPVYRIAKIDDRYQLAAKDEWVNSRASDVEDWFYETNVRLSPDEGNGRQFRRIVRLLKKFARSRRHWKADIAPGFTITKLAEECFSADGEREDRSLRSTMTNIKNRLDLNREVSHPVDPSQLLTSGQDDVGTTNLRDRLRDALDSLKILDSSDCSRRDALRAWDKVFNTDFFSNRPNGSDDDEGDPDSGNHSLSSTDTPGQVHKRGGGRFA